VGVAHGAKVLPVRVLGRCGGYLSDIQTGMRWAAGLETVAGVAPPSPAVKVLNLSLGVDGGCDPVTQSVIDEIRAAGVSVVASAGNDAAETITKPANCMGVVGVTAHTRNGWLATYANVGAGVSVSAPGGDRFNPVMSALNTGTQGPLLDTWGGASGTSMATPLASGVLALMVSARSAQSLPALAMPTLEALMREAVRPFPAGSYCALHPGLCGLGLLDAELAVAAAQAAPAGQADLEVLQRVSASSWVPGSTVVLQIQLRNWGSVAATGVQLTATLSGLELLSVSSDSPAVVLTPVGAGLDAVVGDLPPGVARVVTVNARVTGSADSVSSTAGATGSGPEPTWVNNTHRLVPAGLISGVSTPSVTPSDSGGGCTVAPAGQADAGLPLLALVAALVLLWRRRAPRG
jgi:serine protease